MLLTVLDLKVPEKVWSGHDCTYEHLRPFGYVAHLHTSQGKLNPRAQKRIFVGYPKGVNGYKVWLLEEKKCIISRDVVFNEGVLYKAHDQVQHGVYTPTT